MTTSTPNLSLTLYDSSGDQSTPFSTFRDVLAGPGTSSNFYKIDTAYGTQSSQITSLQSARGAINVGAAYVSANYYEANSITAITSYYSGLAINLSLDTTSNGTVTLNINALGTKSLMKVDTTGSYINLTGADLVKNRKYAFVYDGTRWLWVSSNSADQINIVGTSGNVVTVSSVNQLDGSTTQSSMLSATTHAATSKSTPADSDEFPIADSAASYVLKKTTYSNIKTAVSTYYNTLSATMTNKTLTAPIISSISNSGTITLPTGTDTLVARATTDTLTNKRITQRVTSIASSSTPTINTDNCDAVDITALATDITSMTTSLSGTPTNFQKLIIRFKDNGTARNISWGASFESVGAALPTTTVISKRLVAGFIYDTTTSKWGCVASVQEA